MGQDNSLRKTALSDIASALKEIVTLKEVSQTVKGPEEVVNFPAAYIVGGSGPREPTDIQYVHFEHVALYRIYAYQKSSKAENLAGDLEDIIKLIVDKMDVKAPVFSAASGYDLRVSEIATDEGALAIVGQKLAMAIITIDVKFPSRDA